MQKLGRFVTLLMALALGLGPFAPLRAAPASLPPASMADDMHMAGMTAAGENCAPCAEKPGMMQDCLAPRIALPALAPQQAVLLLSREAGYEPVLERALHGAQSRPDPYPPRSTILA